MLCVFTRVRPLSAVPYGQIILRIVSFLAFGGRGLRLPPASPSTHRRRWELKRRSVALVCIPVFVYDASGAPFPPLVQPNWYTPCAAYIQSEQTDPNCVAAP